MPDNELDAQENSSSPLADAIASSPEALAEGTSQSTESGTPQQPASQENKEENVPFHKHPRFQEIIEENRWLKQQVERSLQNQQSQQQFQQPVTPPQDPFAGMTPEEERFWRAVDQRAEKIAEGKIKQISPVIDAGRMELASMKVQQFRAEHPDVKANSQEEMAIAEKINQGYLPEDAYRSIMWDSKVTEAKNQANQQVKQKIDAKKQANVEHSSIPNGASPPVKENLTLRQKIERNARELGI